MMEFDEILERFKKRRMGPGEAAESTADRYVRHVRNWRNWLAKNGNKTVWEAEYDDLRLFAEELVYQDMAPTTISQRVSAISKFYQDAKKFPDYLDIPEVPENPYDGFDKDDKKLLRGDTKKKTGLKDSEKDEYPYLESEEVEKLVENVPAPRLRNELIIKLLYHIGFRRGELAKAKIKHIDRTDRSVYIPPRKSPEGRHIAYKQDYLGFQLDRWIDHDRDSMTYASESDYLFPTNNNEHISADYIGKVVKKAAENAGLQETIAEYSDGRKLHKVTAHTLRHSYAMRTLKTAEDVDIRTLQSLLGHEELDTTLIYLQQSKEEAKEASRGFVP